MEVKINKGYELYQIITDFGEPLEIFREAFQNSIDSEATELYCRVYDENLISGNNLIIEIYDNGFGLEKSKANVFFDLANSTKIDENKIPISGKLGYKGHGTKIFFNSESVEIFSKNNGKTWSATLINPIEQICETNTFKFNINNINKKDSPIPEEWEHGFYIKIKNPFYFKTEHTRFKLNHMNLRDYANWFTVFGSINQLFDNDYHNATLFLRGYNIDEFSDKFNDINIIEPIPIFEEINNIKYEKLELGHYIPSQRSNEKAMKKYVEKINSNKFYYDFYSKTIFKDIVNCDNNMTFKFLLHVEGYETKRRYDILLTRRGAQRTLISHMDSDRYGLWACKGGVPIEKIDNWIEGSKGTLTYLHGFVDCDRFSLTANRGSIHNTDIEILDIIKRKINDILNRKVIKDALNERNEIESFEKQLASIEDDGKNLKNRFNRASKKRSIILPNNIILKEPQENKTGGYSESETFILLIQLLTIYPNLFDFKLLDYDTRKGIDCVVELNGTPKYIEIKGTLNKKINHPFRYIYKFICYDINLDNNDTVIDIEDFKANLETNKNDEFSSFDDDFKGTRYTSYKLNPAAAKITSMEIICLKKMLVEVLNAEID